MTLFLAVSHTSATFHIRDEHSGKESGRLGLRILGFLYQFKGGTYVVLLAPLKQSALVVGIVDGHTVQIDVLAEDTVFDKPSAILVATVQIHRTNESLKGIASHVAVVRLAHEIASDQVGKPHLICQMPKGLTLHHPASNAGEETFSLATEMVVEDIAHYGIQYGISKVLQALVVGKPAPTLLDRQALVCQSLAVEVYLTWVKSQYSIKRTIKLPVTSERQPYRIYYISCFHRYSTIIPQEPVLAGLYSLFYVLLENHTRIVTAKTKGVAQCGTYLALLRLAECEIQIVIYLRILVTVLMIYCWRNYVFLH